MCGWILAVYGTIPPTKPSGGKSMASISWPPNKAPRAMLQCVRDTEPHSHTEEDTRGHLAGSALSLRKCKIVF